MTQLGVIETSVIPPIVSIRVRLGGRSAPFADRHYTVTGPVCPRDFQKV